ncbi:MAG: SDR family oxidoreductase [Polyangiales bacterium]
MTALQPNTTLVTGFPDHFVSRKLVAHLWQHSDAPLCCLVSADAQTRARKVLRRINQAWSARIQLLEGESHRIDLGLSGREFCDLTAKVRVIHHLALESAQVLNERSVLQQRNDAAGEVLELAEHAKALERVVLWSQSHVRPHAQSAGGSSEPSQVHPAPRSREEVAQVDPERMFRAESAGLPLVILKPALIVGDSRTGEIDRFDGVYLLFLMVLRAPADMPIPWVTHEHRPLNMVPVDHVVRAGAHLAAHPEALGRTFHIADPAPLTTGAVCALVAQAAGQGAPRSMWSAAMAAQLLRAPGIRHLSANPQHWLIALTQTQPTCGEDSGDWLAAAGMPCPPFASYVRPLVRYIRRALAASAQTRR